VVFDNSKYLLLKRNLADWLVGVPLCAKARAWAVGHERRALRVVLHRPYGGGFVEWQVWKC
jgi:hypothetical protein